MPEDAVGDGAIDFDRAWQDLLASLTDDPVVRERAAEPAPQTGYSVPSYDAPPVEDEAGEDVSGEDEAPEPVDEHFVPPPAPPLPTLRPVTIAALLAMVAGLLIIGLQIEGGSLDWLGVLALVGGAASLVYNMRQGPPTDSGWDDGAVI